MLQEMPVMSSGGGGVASYAVAIKHPTANGLTIQSGVQEIDTIGNIASSSNITLTDSHTATDVGGIFDFTLNITNSLSVRVYSNLWSNRFFYVDVIKGGTTVVSASTVDTMVQLDGVYTSVFVVA